jgi:hypothetical protein
VYTGAFLAGDLFYIEDDKRIVVAKAGPLDGVELDMNKFEALDDSFDGAENYTIYVSVSSLSKSLPSDFPSMFTLGFKCRGVEYCWNELGGDAWQQSAKDHALCMKLEKEAKALFISCGFARTVINGMINYERGGKYLMLTYVSDFDAFVIEYASNSEAAQQNRYQDTELYPISLGDRLIDALKSDLEKY